jgi:hypothetical protein
MNYVSVSALRYAAAVMTALDHHGAASLSCQWRETPDAEPCFRPAEYFSPDATRVSAGGDIEAGPQWFCREHLELELGEPVREEPLFRRVENPGD